MLLKAGPPHSRHSTFPHSTIPTIATTSYKHAVPLGTDTIRFPWTFTYTHPAPAVKSFSKSFVEIWASLKLSLISVDFVLTQRVVCLWKAMLLFFRNAQISPKCPTLLRRYFFWPLLQALRWTVLLVHFVHRLVGLHDQTFFKLSKAYRLGSITTWIFFSSLLHGSFHIQSLRRIFCLAFLRVSFSKNINQFLPFYNIFHRFEWSP